MARTTLIDHKKGYKSVFATEGDKIVYHTQQDIANFGLCKNSF